MPFTIPDEAEAAFAAQSGLYQTDVDAVAGGPGFSGVLRGGVVAGGASMVLTVTAGCLVEKGQRFPINAASVTVPTADATNPRFDIVVAYYFGVTVVVAGTAAAAPVPPPVPDGAALLAQVWVPANDTVIAANQVIDKRVLINDENEFASELNYWYAALGNRSRRNANVWIGPADSMAEGAGAPSIDRTWKQLFRTAIQQPYRYGGAGFIPALNVAATPADASLGAPANAHIWTFTGGDDGVPDPGLTYGMGIGRRARWLTSTTTPATATLVFYGDVVRIYYLGSATGIANATIDGVTAGNVNTAVTGMSKSVVHAIGGLPVGWHTLVITPTLAGGAVVLEGAEVMQGDINAGVHVFDNARSGLTTTHFDCASADLSDALWALAGFQPATPFSTTTGSLTSASTTLTDASGAFTTRDVGEWVVFADATKILYGAAKITAFLSSTTVTLDRAALASGSSLGYRMDRSEVATWSFTSGSKTADSTTAAFTKADEGKYIIGSASLPTGTQIQRVVSTTQVTLSKAATSTTGSQTVRILNREAHHASPDLMIWELGINDMASALPIASFKASMAASIIGGLQRMAQDRCSVLVLGMWAPGSDSVNTGMAVDTVNGSPVVTLHDYPVGVFTQADVGKTFALSGAPASAPTGFATTVTISSVSANGQTATMSANANSTQNNVGNQINSRVWSDNMWQPYRRAMREVCQDNGWAFWDMYDFGGFIGTLDPLGLTIDGTHPGQRGQEWLADRMNQVLTGMPKTASLPAGLADYAGQMLVAEGLDTWRAAPGILRKVTADTASGTTAGVMVDITEWGFYIGPGQTLCFEFNLIWTTAATTSGILFDFNPATNVSAPADLVMAAIGATGASAFTQVGRVDAAWGTDLTITGGIGTAVPNLTTIKGSVTAGVFGGLITPRFGPEANAAATLQRGSYGLVL